MSGGTVCHDHGREHWKVTARRTRQSAFDGYAVMSSAYSEVRCFARDPGRITDCGRSWRTKAGYVDRLPDAPSDWWRY